MLPLSFVLSLTPAAPSRPVAPVATVAPVAPLPRLVPADLLARVRLASPHSPGGPSFAAPTAYPAVGSSIRASNGNAHRNVFALHLVSLASHASATHPPRTVAAV